MRRDTRLRWAAALYVLPALGFGLSTPPVLAHLARTGELPTIMGFRALSGPFEALQRELFVGLGWTLVATCVLDLLAGGWLWQGRRRGAWLGLATTPVSLVLAVGFALPILLLVVPIRVALVLAGLRPKSRTDRGGMTWER